MLLPARLNGHHVDNSAEPWHSCDVGASDVYKQVAIIRSSRITMFVLSLFATALAVHAQSREGAFTTITVNGEPTRVGVPASYFDPTGVFAGTTIHSSLLPLICDSVCQGVTTVYGYVRQVQADGSVCFLDFRIWNSTDYSDFDNFIQYSEDECAERLCDPDAYNHLYECANCIVANGGDTTRSTGPTSTASSSAPPQATWPLGPVDEEQGNGWLRNITDFCEARGTSGLGEAEVTAVPTTT